MNKSAFTRVLRYIRPYWGLLAVSIFCAAAASLLALYIPILTGEGIDLLLGAGEVDFSAVRSVLRKILFLTAVTGLAQWVMNVANNKMTYSIVRDIRRDAMEKIQSLPLKYLDAQAHGEVVSRMIADVDQFADGLLMGFTQLFSGIVTILGTIVFMARLNPAVTILVVALTPLSLLIASFIAKKTFNMFRVQSATRGEQTALISEMLGNAAVVKAYGHEKRALAAFDEINKRLSESSLRATFYSSITNPSTRFVNNLVYAAVALFGAFSAIAGKISIGQLTCFLSYANQYTKPFNEISGVVTEFQNALACAARIFELMDEEPQIPEAVNAMVLDRADGRLSLDEVSFSYTPDQDLIRDFSLTVHPGQRIAIVGPTGCGKTTIINLLMRFYDVQKGSICVMGTDIREMTRESLRRNYGMVLQETWLKNGTVRENIAMGKPGASDEEIIEAAKAAHAHEFVRRLPQAYETVLSEEGSGLSQGQKQLLCIARIMLSLPPMLILDEATSSIDTRTELLIQNAFARMMRGRTSFIVAHRLSTIREADVILVMNQGRIIEQGTHSQLLKKNGFYAELYNAQFNIG